MPRVVAALLIVVCSCHTAKPDGDGPPPAGTGHAAAPGVKDTNSVSVTLDRGACYGTCPIYSVTMLGSGAVTFKGERFVTTEGTATATVSRDTVRQVLEAFDRASFSSLPSSYQPGDSTCPHAATDMPSVNLTWEADGASKSVHFYYGCTGITTSIPALSMKVGSLLDIGRWIK